MFVYEQHPFGDIKQSITLTFGQHEQLTSLEHLPVVEEGRGELVFLNECVCLSFVDASKYCEHMIQRTHFRKQCLRLRLRFVFQALKVYVRSILIDPAFHFGNLVRYLKSLYMLEDALLMQRLHPVQLQASLRSEEIVHEAPLFHCFFMRSRND